MVLRSIRAYIGAFLVASGALQSLAPDALAQVPSLRGATLTKVRDLDGDGHADFVVLRTVNPNGRGFVFDQLELLSGRTMTAFASVSPGNLQLKSPRAFGLGDIDGDGFADIAVSSKAKKKRADKLYFFSGRDGSPIQRNVKLGKRGVSIMAVTWLTDVNGDGIDDFAVGTAQERPELRALQIVSGLNGRILKKLKTKRADQQFAQSLATIDDINGDGHPEIVAGGTHRSKSPGGAFVVLSGSNLSLLYERKGKRGFLLGDDVLSGVDLDEDQYREFVVSEYDRSRGGHIFRIINGRTFAEHFSIGIFEGPIRLNSVVVDFVSDVNDDCTPDILVSARNATLRVHSGADGSLDQEIGSAPSFGVLGSMSAIGVSHSYRIGLAARGTGEISVQNFEEVFYPPPFSAPSCIYSADRFL